ncbi:MAG: DUF4297 domain-containing protein [Betaproteobacteria bacterium]
MALSDELLKHRPRESGGSTGGNRYAYQRTWALCRLLTLHESRASYVLVMEYHEDIIVLDHDVNPTNVDFYQIKTRNKGNWTKKDLYGVRKPRTKTDAANQSNTTSTSAKLPQSYLGKMFSNCLHFMPHLQSINFVSNQRFNMELAEAPKSVECNDVCLSRLSQIEADELTAAMTAELSLMEPLPLDKTHLIVTDMGIHDHLTHGAGKLSEFLERRRPGARYPVQPLFKTLCGEIERRSNNEWQPTTFTQLCENKGIRRADMEAHLLAAEVPSDPAQLLMETKAQLQGEGVDYRTVTILEAAWHEYDMHKTNHADTALQTFKDQIVDALVTAEASQSWRTLAQLLDLVEHTYVSRYGAPEYPRSLTDLKGAALYEHKYRQAREFSPNGAKSPTKEQ